MRRGSCHVAEALHDGAEHPNELREAEVEISKGATIAQVVRRLGITDQTYYRWRREYGGLRLDQAKRLKDLEKENRRLKRIVADQALDIAILRETSDPNL